MIEVRNLSRSFGSVHAVRDVSFSVEEGSLCGVLGRNGAGKSTLFRMLTGLTRPDSGSILLDGSPLRFEDPGPKNKIGFVPETDVLFEYLTVREYLEFVAEARSVPQPARSDSIARWLDRFELAERADTLIITLSLGMRRKVSLIAALIGSPRLLVLDEPTNGLDPEIRFRFKETLVEFSRGGAVLLSTHAIETVEFLCDRILIMDRGRILHDLRREEWTSLRAAGSSLEEEFLRRIRAGAEGARE